MNLDRLLLAPAADRPDAIALHGDDVTLTWCDYERASRRLAQTLIAAGVQAGDRVAVSRLKSVEAYVAVHGVIRAGAVFVPIDPLAPAASGQAVLAEADVAAAILDEHTTQRLAPGETLVDARIVIGPSGVGWDEAIAEPADGADPELPVAADDDPVYIIFTSGSTGTPKGIVHTQRSARVYVENAAIAHQMTDADVVSGMCGFHFDMSTFELYVAPAVQAPVVIMNEAVMRFPASFAQRSAAHRVTVWYTVPFFLRSLTERGSLDETDLSSLRLLKFAGEPYPPHALAELIALLPETTLLSNVYGPAETNESNYWDLHDFDPEAGEVPVGPVWAPTTGKVVDDQGTEVSVGEPGELWLTSESLMQGYWRRPDLTEASIVVDVDGTRWYRSGDIVELDADGVCHFRGRVDHQVKVRGVRLELEAIESVLTDAPGVAHAVVGPVGSVGEIDHLGALVVLSEGAELDLRAIRRWCSARLHPAAVPSWAEAAPAFPQTASGKINRKVIRNAISRRTDDGAAVEHLEELTRDR